MDRPGRLYKLVATGVATLMALVLSSGAMAASKTEKRISDAIDVLSDFTNIPEGGIPDTLLSNAYGVAVIPGVIKAGFGIGGRYGKGILIVRQNDGAWSNPTFVSFGGGSIGWQIGAQSTDLIMVFKDRRSIDSIHKGKLTLGGDASVAAGPVGRATSASTDGKLSAEIYSYSRNRGLFAGAALDGSWLAMDDKSNASYYGNGLSPMQILDARNIPAPASAQRFVKLMAATAPRVDISPAAAKAVAVMPAAGPADAPAKNDEVRTYAIEPVDGPPDETLF